MKRAMMLVVMIAVLIGVAFAVEPADKESTEKKEPKIDVKNPIRKVSGMMKKAGKLLDDMKTGEPTQEEQKKILKELDRLIQLAQQSQSSSSQTHPKKQGDPNNSDKQPQNTGGSGSSPMSDERDVYRAVRPRLGTGAPDLREMWGKLQDMPRDEILQLLNEKLPMKYKQLLYLYFKALSEKK